jgi:hypothetical protein
MAVRLSALRIYRSVLPQKHFSASNTHFCYRLSKTRGLVRLEGLDKLIKFIGLIGTRTRDLPASSVALQRITLRRALWMLWILL